MREKIFKMTELIEYLNPEKTFVNYFEQLEALENYVESIEELLFERQKSQFVNNERLSHISEVIATKLIMELPKKDSTFNEKTKETDKHESISSLEIAATSEKSSKQELITDFEKNFITDRIREDLKYIKINLDNDVISFTITDKEKGKDFAEYFNSINEVRSHTELLYRSTLISLAVTFELLITNMIHYRAIKFPNSININEKKLSFKEIENLGSFEEAKNYLVEDHVTELMRKSNEEWISYIKKNFSVKVDKEIEEYEGIINETFNRRNLVVHGGGIINNIYITKVDENLRKGLKKGDKIDINKEYILERINIFKVYGLALMYGFWMGMEKGNENRAMIAQNYAYNLLKKNQYILARKLYKVILSDKLPQSIEFMVKINYWQTYKWNDELELVKEEIEDIDFSASTLNFQMCKDLLLDKNDEALEKLKKIVSSGDYDLDDLLDWPILRNLHKERNFENYLVEMGYEIEHKKEDIENDDI